MISIGFRRLIHIGIPAVANISHHVVESVHFLLGKVWRGVLRDQDEVLQNYKNNEIWRRDSGSYLVFKKCDQC